MVGEDIFIKQNMTIDIDMPGSEVKTPISFIVRSIAEKNTTF